MGFEPAEVANTVTQYILAIAGAGAAVLALTIGLAAAWRYAKKFLKG
ncbi:hypothetical protein [Thermus caldifontis]|nr:hypothetical protein [Thermus caldifontis]